MSLAAILVDNRYKDMPGLQKFFSITYSKIRTLTDEIYLLTANAQVHAEGLKIITFDKSRNFLSFLKNDLAGKTIIITNAYSPLLDVDSTVKMLGEHDKYAFDYSFPENMPQGLLPEIIESDTAGFILNTIPEEYPMFKNSLKEIFESDISSYDCNIFISPGRLVNYRINFIPDSYNDYLVLDDIISRKGESLNHLELEKMLKNDPEMIRKRPTYYEIELNTERESGNLFISDRLSRSGEMEIKNLKEIMKDIYDFSYNPAVSFGLFGEPFLYTHIDELIDELHNYPEMQFIFESRCLFTGTESINKLLSLPNSKVIFDISFTRLESFSKNKKPLNALLPPADLPEIEGKINSLANREKVYIQFTRTTENENEIIRFYERWSPYSERIIIKKPDTFGGLLDKYRVVDLSPLKRFPCLHMKHDMVILSDGSVPLCRQDYNNDFRMGNILNEGLEACWSRIKTGYKNQWNENYTDPGLCSKCDEWWVFNL